MELHEKFISMKIFFDLDGTLIDSKSRLYHLFQEIVPKSNLEFEEYWIHKKNGISHSVLLSSMFNFSESDILLFENKWMKLIETKDWLKYDRPIAGVTDYLKSLKQQGFVLYVVTARQFKSVVFDQIESFGWDTFFEEILVTEQQSSKKSLIEPHLSISEINWIVGDTGLDIKTGKLLGMKTVAVLSGFLNYDVLIKYSPHYIYQNVLEFNPLIE